MYLDFVFTLILRCLHFVQPYLDFLCDRRVLKPTASWLEVWFMLLLFFDILYRYL